MMYSSLQIDLLRLCVLAEWFDRLQNVCGKSASGSQAAIIFTVEVRGEYYLDKAFLWKTFELFKNALSNLEIPKTFLESSVFG